MVSGMSSGFARTCQVWTRAARIAACLVALLAMWGPRPALAVPEFLKNQLHKEEEYKILVIKGKEPSALVQKVAAHPGDYKIIVVQCAPEELKVADAVQLLAWVEHGGSLWFQDCRLAPQFGLQPDPLHVKELVRAKEHKGEYGGRKKVPGVATFSIAPPNSGVPLLTGVDTVQVFLLRVGDDMFSALHLTSDLTPLLKVQVATGQPFFDRVIAGVKKHGQGTIVFKPLVFTEQLTGERFQLNLLEWSAGFGIPDFSHMTGETTPKNKTSPAATSAANVDRVLMRDKSVLEGAILTRSFKLTVLEPLSTGEVFMTAVADICMQEDGARDAVRLRDGKKLMGMVSFPDDLRLREAGGTVKTLRKFDIARILLSAPQATGPSAH